MCIDKAGGNAGRGTGPADMLNELMEFVTLSIKSEDLGSGDIPRVRLGGMQMPTGDTNGSRGQTDWLDDQTDELRGQTYVPNQSNNAEMAGISHGDGAGMYLGAGDAKRGVEVTNGIRVLKSGPKIRQKLVTGPNRDCFGPNRSCRCHTPNMFGTVNMEHTINLRLSWSKR